MAGQSTVLEVAVAWEDSEAGLGRETAKALYAQLKILASPSYSD